MKGLKRERKFQVIERDKGRQLLTLRCSNCGHEFNVKEVYDNFYFKCPSTICGAESNLQDVLVMEVELIQSRIDDPEKGITRADRSAIIADICRRFPHPGEIKDGNK